MKGSSVCLAASLLAAAVLSVGCATTKPTAAQNDAFKVAVDRIFRLWSDTNTNPDLDGFVALWDEKAVKMAAGRPTAVGSEAIRQMKQKAFGVTLYDAFEVKIDEYQLAGEFGWARGLYTIVTRPKAGGEPFTDIGTFLTMFRKQADGSWKVYRDTMMPLPR